MADFGGAAPLLDGVGASLLNMPLQEQLRMMQQAQLLHPDQLVMPSGATTPEPTPRRGARTPRSRSRASADGSASKPLSSRYRGVCWNRKNKRWQAAINCGGKYLYLGSYVEEEDAAKAFDRAAIKTRGRKAKVNFNYDDYVDENGNLKVDIALSTEGGPRRAAAGGSGGGGGGSSRSGARKRKAPDAGAPAPLAAPGLAPTVTSMGGGGGLFGGFFGSSLAGVSMDDVKRMLTSGLGLGGAAPAATPPPASGRGVTTGYVGAPGASTSAFAAEAGALAPSLPLHLPGALGPGVGGADAAAAAAGGAGWQELMQQFAPVIESELGQGRTLTRLVDPPHAAAAPGGAGAGSLVRGVVYEQAPAPAPARPTRGASGAAPTYGVALWDGARLRDHGPQMSLEAALETATSLAAGEEDLQADAALRELLGGPSALVPRAGSLALFSALGSLREPLPPLDIPPNADAGASGSAPPAKRAKSATGGGKAAKRGKGKDAAAAAAPQPPQPAADDVAWGDEPDLRLPTSLRAKSGSFRAGGEPGDEQQRQGTFGRSSFSALLSRSPLSEMLKSLRSLGGSLTLPGRGSGGGASSP